MALDRIRRMVGERRFALGVQLIAGHRDPIVIAEAYSDLAEGAIVALAEAVERDQTSYVARGGQTSGVVDMGPAPGDEQPSQARAGGTSGGDPLSGVTASKQDVEEAVSGDTGPEHPGRQG